MDTKNILFVIPAMQLGGAERVVSVMANYWAEKKYAISVIVFNDKESFYKLSTSIKFYKLNSSKNKFGIFNFLVNNVIRLINYIRYVKLIKPDIIISFTDNANVYTVLYNYILRRPIIISQRTNPNFTPLPKILKSFPGRIYKKADAIVVQTAATIKIYQTLKIKLPAITEIIYNPLQKKLQSLNEVNKRENIILAVGRLYNKIKNHNKLIDIFYGINNSSWKLYIAGEGPDKKILQDKIEQLNLTGKVVLLGSQNDLASLYKTVKIFVLTSVYEGFPNALAEAMAAGCACISYDCATGPSEIIKNGENGILVETGNETELKSQLTLLMADEAKINRFSNEAIKIQSLLDENKIMLQWEHLVNKVLKTT